MNNPIIFLNMNIEKFQQEFFIKKTHFLLQVLKLILIYFRFFSKTDLKTR